MDSQEQVQEQEQVQADDATAAAMLRRLLPLMAVLVLAHLAFTGGRVSLTLYAITLHASTFVVGLQVSLLSILPMLLSVRLGRWIDRVGMKRRPASAPP
jgi:MFS family permease